MTILAPGANAAVIGDELTLSIRHGTIFGADLDVSAFLVGVSGKVRTDDDMCFYAQRQVANGALSLTSTGDGTTTFRVQAARLPSDVEKIVVAATIHENRATFAQAQAIEIELVHGGPTILGKIASDGRRETALLLCEIYRRAGVWKLRVVGQGFEGGLPALALYMGVDISDAPAPTSTSRASPPAPTPTPAPAPKVNLTKISLTKEQRTVSLKKASGRYGKIRVNLNWNQRPQGGGGLFSGFRKQAGIDLDVGCLIEGRDGTLSVVQALGNAFGDYQRFPFVKLLGDDRTGAAVDGEWIEINGESWSELRRVLVYAFIYEGAPNWQATDGIVRVLVPDQPEVEVRMNDYGSTEGTCAVALLENDGGQVKVNREVKFFRGQAVMDRAYHWGLQWSAGRK